MKLVALVKIYFQRKGPLQNTKLLLLAIHCLTEEIGLASTPINTAFFVCIMDHLVSASTSRTTLMVHSGDDEGVCVAH